jgi:hypothetical protein
MTSIVTDRLCESMPITTWLSSPTILSLPRD